MNVSNLNFKYTSSKYVLENVSFTLSSEKLNVLVGLNGAGKTTLLDCITNNLELESGEINLPRDLDTLYITQRIFFSNELKGKDFIKFIGELVKVKKVNLDHFISDFAQEQKNMFQHLWTMKIGQMSVGELKQLIFFTLLKFINNRKMYIFDEITSGVDPIARKRIFSAINKLIQNDKICLLATHQLHDLEAFDPHLIVLHHGRVHYEGDYSEWLKKYNTTNPDEAFDHNLKEAVSE